MVGDDVMLVFVAGIFVGVTLVIAVAYLAGLINWIGARHERCPDWCDITVAHHHVNPEPER